MPITINGSGTVTGISAGGLPDGVITTDDIAANAVTPAKLATTVVGPAFSVYQSSAQSITNGTNTKISLQTEDYDTANCFDTSLSRFTPNVAGYYQFNLQAYLSTGSQVELALFIYKNGSALRYVGDVITPLGRMVNGSIAVYMNGTTDYVEMYLYSSVSGTTSVNTSMFSGALIRPA